MSSKLSTFLCDSSLRSFISRNAVMGNCVMGVSDCALELAARAPMGRCPPTHAIFLVVHDDLLERHNCAGLLGPRAMHLAKGSLSEFTEDLVVSNARTAHETISGSLVLDSKGVRRTGRASAERWCAHRGR